MDRKSQWKPVFATLSGKQGFIAVTALLIMVILLMFGVTFLTMATTENTMVTNGINGQVAFNIAEAGIDHAKRVLLDPINNNLNSICAVVPNRHRIIAAS